MCCKRLEYRCHNDVCSIQNNIKTMIKKVLEEIKEFIRKLRFKHKLWEMDFFADYTGMSSWMLFPPSFYYTHTEEEIAQATAAVKAKVYAILDEWEREEQERRELEEKKVG